MIGSPLEIVDAAASVAAVAVVGFAGFQMRRGNRAVNGLLDLLGELDAERERLETVRREWEASGEGHAPGP